MAKNKPGSSEVDLESTSSNSLDNAKVDSSIVPTKEQIMKNKYMIKEQKKPYVYKDPVAKRYRKKMVANFLITLSVVTLAVFIILAYIGTLIGNLTVQLKNDQAYLTMAPTYTFEGQNTRLKGDSANSPYPCDVDRLPSDETLDADIADKSRASHNGVDDTEGGSGGVYLAFTWYVKNVSTHDIGLKYAIEIAKLKLSMDNDYSVDECMRVRLYENLVTYSNDGTAPDPSKATHNYRTFAKEISLDVNPNRSLVPLKNEHGDYIYNEQGEKTYETRECEGSQNGDGVCTGNHNKRCETFYSSKFIVYNPATRLNAHQVMRYTIVCWIEGNDPECDGKPPSGAGIEFSVIFNFAGEYDDQGRLIDAEGNEVVDKGPSKKKDQNSKFNYF